MKYLSNGGRLVNVSSTWGFYGIGEIPRYVAASHAIIGMSRSFAVSFFSFLFGDLFLWVRQILL